MQRKFGIGIVSVLILLLTVSAFAATLPTVGGDNGEWGTVLNTFLQVAHDSGGNIQSSYITSSMIADATITSIDIASGAVNTTHIVDGTIANADVASNAINGSQVAQTTGFNVSSLIVNVNNTGGRGATAANISGIYINSSYIQLPSINGGQCFIVPINMTGIPAGMNCFAMGDRNADIMGFQKLSIVGVNSTVGNCRLRVCHEGPAAVTLPNIKFTAMGIVTGGV